MHKQASDPQTPLLSKEMQDDADKTTGEQKPTISKVKGRSSNQDVFSTVR